ncbi:hypothetical protein N0V88_006282 [Collariella sp. IMI 366227]|nr:hypothetical protein N0V88_006282 [Collariella sp. IMI 366227]
MLKALQLDGPGAQQGRLKCCYENEDVHWVYNTFLLDAQLAFIEVSSRLIANAGCDIEDEEEYYHQEELNKRLKERTRAIKKARTRAWRDGIQEASEAKKPDKITSEAASI